LSLCLYASSLFEDQNTGETSEIQKRAGLLLDLLIPIVKSWPSKYCLKANELAIQVLGGSGYIREYPIEQFYRDNRLNPIHEGTEGIQGLDLLGRKVMQHDMAAYHIFQEEVRSSLVEANLYNDTQAFVDPLESALQTLDLVTSSLQKQISKDVDLGLANATLYLDFFGRIVVTWIWLRQAIKATEALQQTNISQIDADFYRGKIQAAHYYLTWELPHIKPQADLLKQGNPIGYKMQDSW